MVTWLALAGGLFVLGIVMYWLVSMPLRDLIAVSGKKKKH